MITKSQIVRLMGYLLIGSTLHAQGVRDLSDFTLGLNTHHLGGEVDERLKILGVGGTRCDLNWKRISDTHGVIDPENKAYLSILQAPPFLIDPLVVLAYGHPGFDGGGRIVSPKGREAYLAYALASVQRLSPRTRLFEVWNEWNSPGMGGAPLSEGSGKVDDYLTLLKKTYANLKKAYPNLTLLGGATWGIGDKDNFMINELRGGLLDSIDGLSIHPYFYWQRQLPEVALSVSLSTLRSWLNSYPKGPSMPLYVTELGWPTFDAAHGVTMDEQAKYMARSVLLLAAEPQIKGVWIYELRDGGTDPKDKECHFGILQNDGKPKPSFFVMKELARLLHESSSIRKMPAGTSDEIYFIKLTDNAGASKIICWTVKPNAPWKIRINAGQDSVIHAHEIGASEIVLKPEASSDASVASKASYVLSIPDMPVVIDGLSSRDTLEPFAPGR